METDADCSFRAALPTGAGRGGSLLRAAGPVSCRRWGSGDGLHLGGARPRSVLVAARALLTGGRERRGRRRGAPLCPLALARPALSAEAALVSPAPPLAMPDAALQPDFLVDVAGRRTDCSALRRGSCDRLPFRLADRLWTAAGATAARAVRADALPSPGRP